ncbi:MAG TPA: ABC transporter permease [Bryobacteraceae bacterium]|jgi:predicted permease|nr:ABC transporter permease [Bryobacteraceae bacterium]
MKWSDFVLRLRALLFRSRVESELDDELQFHLEMEARKRSAAGIEPALAKRKAEIAFGGAEQVKEGCRDARGTRWIENFFQDLRFGLRMLRKDRGYAAAAIAALAVGIGANTALFLVFAAVALKPLPVPDPASLISLSRNTAQIPRGGIFSFADYSYFRDRNSVFSSIAAEQPAHLHLAGVPDAPASGDGVAEPVMSLFVTANYLATFGIRPIAGRDFLPAEDHAAGGPYPVLLSENYWQRRFGRDPDILGRSLMFSGIPATVAGITPRDFMGTRPDVPDVWIVMAALGDPQRRTLDRTVLCCAVTARLKPGTSLQQAQAEISVLAGTLRREYPEAERQWTVLAGPANRFGAGKTGFVILFGTLQVAMGLVLLIACSNVAGLLLGRAATRQREIAVRLAMGATRDRLVRQLVTEGVLISLLAGTSAFLITWQALAAINHAVSTGLAAQGGTIAIDVSPDLHVLLYILFISTLAGVSFALAPAMQSTRPDLVSALKDENAGFGSRRKGRLRGWMVTGQIAVCLALLIGAGLLTSSSVRVLSVDPGFETHAVLNMTMPSPQELGYPAARMQELQARLGERLRVVPGVVSVGFASRIPLGGNITNTLVAPQAGTSTPLPAERAQQFPYTYVSEDYFQTLGIPLLRGRGFAAQDIATNAPVAVISDALARRFWPGGDAIGKRIALGSPTEVRFAGRRRAFSSSTEVIGIARDVYSMSLSNPDPGAVYLPQPRDEWNWLVFVRAAGDPNIVAGALAREVHSAEPRLPVSIETMNHMISTGEASAVYRIGAMVFAAIGLIGFALAAVGVYSMVAYTVTQQTREVGIRMALGAQRRDVLRLLLGASSKWIAAGLLFGAGLGAVLSRELASQLLLQGGGFLDPAVILTVSALTGGLAMLAAYFPARRATRLDPAVTLRFE